MNLAGQVVGINTLIVRGSDTGGAIAEYLGFAVPSNVSRAVAEKLIETGYIARPSLGVNWGWITSQTAARFQLPVDYGIYLSEVAPGGAADQAGLQRGDILVAIDGQPFDDEHPFMNQFFKYEPGEEVTFDVIRDGRQMKVKVTLGQS